MVVVDKFADSLCRGVHGEISKNLEKARKFMISGEISQNLDLLKFVNEVFTHNNKLRILLVFMIKHYSWNKELQNTYGISNFQLSNILDEFRDLGIITNYDYYSLDDNLQEVIMKTSHNMINWLNSNPIIYVITEKGKIICDNFEESIKKSIQNNESMLNSFQFILNKTKASRELMNKIHNEETRYLTRMVKSPFENVYIEKETLLAKKLRHDLLEHKQTLCIGKSTQLAIRYEPLRDNRGNILPTKTYTQYIQSSNKTYTEEKGKSEQEIEAYVQKRQDMLLRLFNL